MFDTRSLRAKKMNKERLKLRSQLWEGAEYYCWDRKKAKGFTTIPRILSISCSIFQDLELRGNPSSVYIDLWCRAMDEQFATITSEDDAAFSAGYRGKRATRTWRDHIDSLEKCGFIKKAPRGNNNYGYILLINPYIAIAKLYKDGRINEYGWNAIRQRCLEVGALPELDGEIPPPPPEPPKSPENLEEK